MIRTRTVVRTVALHYGDGSQELLLSCGHSVWVEGTRDRLGHDFPCEACALGAPAPGLLVDSSILALDRPRPRRLLGMLARYTPATKIGVDR